MTLSDETVDRVCADIRNRVRPQICINDTDRIADPARCFAAVAAAFDAILPEKSSFEK